MFIVLLSLWLRVAMADQFAVVVDTSLSMAQQVNGKAANDKDRLAILGTLMLSDLLDHSKDEFFVIPFVKENPNDKSCKRFDVSQNLSPTVLHRKQVGGLSMAGNNEFRNKLQESLAYEAKCTYFAPYLRLANRKLKRNASKHRKNVIIFLTDGKSDVKSGKEIAAFQKLIPRLDNNNTKVWFIGVGKNLDEQILAYFAAQNRGGFKKVDKDNPADLLHAFASILQEETNRRLIGKKANNRIVPKYLPKGRAQKFLVPKEVTQIDLIVIDPNKKGLIKNNNSILTQPNGQVFAAANNTLFDLVGFVRDESRRSFRITRSYRRIRILNPANGAKWEIKDTQQDLMYFALLQYDYNVKFSLRSSQKEFWNTPLTEPVVHVPADREICIDAFVTASQSSNQKLEEQDLVDNKITLHAHFDNLDDGTTGVKNPVGELSFAENTAMGMKANDNIAGVCWKPHLDEVGRTFRLKIQLKDKYKRETTATNERKLLVIPPMTLAPVPSLVKILKDDGQKELSTDDQGFGTFKLGKPTSTFQYKSSAGTWQEGADFIVHVGYCKDHINEGDDIQPCPPDKWQPENNKHPGILEAKYCRKCQFKLGQNSNVNNWHFIPEHGTTEAAWGWDQLKWLPGQDPTEAATTPTTSEATTNETTRSTSREGSNSQQTTQETSNNDKSSHRVEVVMGTRSDKSSETRHMRLRIYPQDLTYRRFVPPTDIVLEIHAKDPGFWEQWGPVVLFGLFFLSGFAVIRYSRRKPTLPVDLQIAIWQGSPDFPNNWRPTNGAQEQSFSEIGVTLRASDKGVVAISKQTVYCRSGQSSLWSKHCGADEEKILFAEITYKTQKTYFRIKSEGII